MNHTFRILSSLALMLALGSLAQGQGVVSVNFQDDVPAAPATATPEVGQSYIDQGASCCDNSYACGGVLSRLLLPSDACFDNFISPMTNPVFFEDPRNLTEARLIFFNHKVPLAAGGGDVQLYAMQLRAKLSENVSLIATKDGYIDSDNPLIEPGWADLAAGLKFNLIKDPQCQQLLSGGFTFELPTGEARALQGNGNGELNLFTTYGQQVGARSHWISAAGLRIPMNTTDESMSGYWSNHFDYMLRPGFYWLAEANWYHWLQAGLDGPIPGIEGLDVINLGNPGVAGNDILTAATGFKFKRNNRNELGIAFEFPITERRDIIDNRLTLDWIIRY